MKSRKREGGTDQKNRLSPDNKRFGKTMGDLQKAQPYVVVPMFNSIPLWLWRCCESEAVPEKKKLHAGTSLAGGAIHFFTHTALKSGTAHWWVRVQFSLRLFCHLAFTLCQDGQTCPTGSSLHTNLVNKKGWQFWKWEIKPSLKTAGGHKVLALQGWWLPSPTDDGCVQARAPSRLGFGGHHQ